MTDPTPLSPAAQAVLDAFWKDLDLRENVASALRAIALHIDDASDGLECQDILRQIAYELEGIDD